jgi:hypothetical protein
MILHILYWLTVRGSPADTIYNNKLYRAKAVRWKRWLGNVMPNSSAH